MPKPCTLTGAHRRCSVGRCAKTGACDGGGARPPPPPSRASRSFSWRRSSFFRFTISAYNLSRYSAIVYCAHKDAQCIA